LALVSQIAETAFWLMLHLCQSWRKWLRIGQIDQWWMALRLSSLQLASRRSPNLAA